MALIQHANLKPWAAITGPRRAILHPDLDHRNDEDPDKRWVLAKSVHALRVWAPHLPLDQDPDARYTDADAEAYARRALMPAIELRAGAHLPDDQLAACLRVPVEKIADRRAELAAEQDQARPGQRAQSCSTRGPRDTSHSLPTDASTAGADNAPHDAERQVRYDPNPTSRVRHRAPPPSSLPKGDGDKP